MFSQKAKAIWLRFSPSRTDIPLLSLETFQQIIGIIPTFFWNLYNQNIYKPSIYIYTYMQKNIYLTKDEYQFVQDNCEDFSLFVRKIIQYLRAMDLKLHVDNIGVKVNRKIKHGKEVNIVPETQ